MQTLSGASGVKLTATVTKVVDPAPGATGGTTSAGTRVVEVVLTVNDASEAPIVGDRDGDPTISASVTDGGGTSYQVDSGIVLSSCPAFPQSQINLKPSESVTGCLAFSVPTGTTLTKFEFTPIVGFGAVGTWNLS